MGYIQERKKWIEAGRPMRPQGEMTRIFMEECSPCKHLRRLPGQRDQCKVCGCLLHPALEVMNKLAWATTKCPLPTPKWEPWNTTDS